MDTAWSKTRLEVQNMRDDASKVPNDYLNRPQPHYRIINDFPR
jgi:hypothetical protein